MRDERLLVLLDAYLDGALTADEKQELERMLLESDAARREFWQRASLHGWSYAAAKLNYGAKTAPELAKERRELRGASFEAFLNWLRHVSQFGWKAALVGAGFAAALILWTSIRSLQSSDETEVAESYPEPLPGPKGIARLTRGTGVVWEAGTNSAEIGASLSPGWLQLKSGAVQIEFDSGARVILEGPAALEVISPGEARLRYGRLNARVPEPAHGFKVYTPDVTVTDLGTEFGLNRPMSLPVEVQVFEGKVEVAVDGTKQPQLLNAGQGVQVSSREVRALPAVDRQKFLSAEELARREAGELRARYQSWKQSAGSLDKDSALLVHFNFEDRRNVDRNLINYAPSAKAGARAMIFGCDWVEGRWPGKGALEFNSGDDRVRLSVPGEFQSLTYMAWVRVDSLPNEWNALALVDTFKTGETHWQIHRNGTLEFSIRPEGGKSGWDRLVSPPVITSGLFGHWIHLAAVRDGKTEKVTVYLNGKAVASKTIARKRDMTLGALELGNWSPTATKGAANYRIRDFHGRMDEFMLLSRPLSADEIRAQYELGKPRETTAVAAAVPPSKAR